MARDPHSQFFPRAAGRLSWPPLSSLGLPGFLHTTSVPVPRALERSEHVLGSLGRWKGVRLLAPASPFRRPPSPGGTRTVLNPHPVTQHPVWELGGMAGIRVWLARASRPPGQPKPAGCAGWAETAGAELGRAGRGQVGGGQRCGVGAGIYSPG